LFVEGNVGLMRGAGKVRAGTRLPFRHLCDVWIRAAIPEVRAPQWSRTEIKIDGEELSIIKESDIMGIIESKRAASKAA
jgi:hypothetical protein